MIQNAEINENLKLRAFIICTLNQTFYLRYGRLINIVNCSNVIKGACAKVITAYTFYIEPFWFKKFPKGT